MKPGPAKLLEKMRVPPDSLSTARPKRVQSKTTESTALLAPKSKLQVLSALQLKHQVASAYMRLQEYFQREADYQLVFSEVSRPDKRLVCFDKRAATSRPELVIGRNYELCRLKQLKIFDTTICSFDSMRSI